MIRYLKAFYYSFPIQLVILHIKKFQVLLFFWYILFSTVNAGFMESFGAYALFLAPEYLGKVNSISAGVVGAATGVFIMSWNITTFILFSRHFRFLATTTKPFLKYCVNNSIIPVCFLLVYFFEAFSYDRKMELIPFGEFVGIAAGFLVALGKARMTQRPSQPFPMCYQE